MISIEEVKIISLDPGKVLVLKVSGVLTEQSKQRISDELSGIFPGNGVLILDGRASLEVIEKI